MLEPIQYGVAACKCAVLSEACVRSAHAAFAFVSVRMNSSTKASEAIVTLTPTFVVHYQTQIMVHCNAHDVQLLCAE
jgi:hypothetical protein